MPHKSEHARLKIREKSRDTENLIQSSKYAKFHDFSIQESRNVLFRKSKEMCTV